MKRSGLPTLLLPLVFFVLGTGAAWAENRALLIGIGQYELRTAGLPGVDKDIRMMRESALALGFTPDQIKILSHSEATLEAIVEAIESWLVDGTKPEDRALYYHSGHGTLVEDENGDEDDGTDEALLPYDFGGGSPYYEDGDKPLRVLLDDDLGRLFEKIPAREVVVLVDTCYSGTMTRGGITRSNDKYYPWDGMPAGSASSLVDKRIERYEPVVLLAAAKPDEKAQTSPQGALFTQGIHHAVHRAAAGRHLTLEELRDETGRFIRDTVGDRHRELWHTPTLDGNRALARLNLFLPEPPVSISQPAPPPPAVAALTRPTIRPPVSVPSSPPAAYGPPPVPTPPSPPPSTPPTADVAGDLWSRLEVLVRDARDVMSVRSGKSVYRVGESLTISVVAPADGYLHVLNVGDGEDEVMLLFPNRYQPANRVRGGQIVHIPDPKVFRLPAGLPAGRREQKNLVAVIHTADPLNLYEHPSSTEEAFRVLRGSEVRNTLRSFRPAAPVETASYSAAQVIVTIEK